MNDIIVVGGGPIGLNAAILASQAGLRGLLVESSCALGGQLTELYPEKEIVDIPGIPSIIARAYVERLVSEIYQSRNSIKVCFNERVIGLKGNGSFIEVTTDNHIYKSKTVIIATGLGVYVPRTMGLPGEDKIDNILYCLKDLEILRGKKVVIMGGGDSALDWAKMSSQVADSVTIVHRRREFRGDINTIESIKSIMIKTPFIPVGFTEENGNIVSLKLQNVETSEIISLPADFVFVNYGHIPSSDMFGLTKLGIGAKVNEGMLTDMRAVYAIGDFAGYDGKLKRIGPGIAEAKVAISEILKIVR